MVHKMIKQTVFLLKIIVICLFTTNLSASEKIQIEQFNDWSVLRQETDAGRLCAQHPLVHQARIWPQTTPSLLRSCLGQAKEQDVPAQ